MAEMIKTISAREKNIGKEENAEIIVLAMIQMTKVSI